MHRVLGPITVLALAGTILAGDADPAAIDFFEKKVRPVLAENCFGCHGPAKQKAKLRLDHISTILKGGESGPVIVPGEPGRSRLVDAIRYANPELQMPPKGRLPDLVVADLEAWVAMGTPWPNEAAPAGAEPEKTGSLRPFDLEARRRGHWSWQPVRPRDLPAVKDGAWPRSPVDRFILAKLEENGLAPAPPADRCTLVRRVYHDLIGLPPPPGEVDAFALDDSPRALEDLVDRLLASERFGERWTRHWLDLVRYAETLGHEFDYPIPNAWRYRDYVIRALNADLPYDQLMAEHVAGDLLESPRRGPDGSNESVIGTGFFWFGQQVHSPVDLRQHTAERIDNQIDVLAKTFLGLTVACARCHDHKFDAIPTRDYYSLYGIISSSRYAQAQIDRPERIEGKAEWLRELRGEMRKVLGESRAKQVGRSITESLAGEDKAISFTGPQRADDILFADFQGPSWDGWIPEGPAFASGPEETGAIVVAGDEKAPSFKVLSGGWAHSGSVSRRLQGALRSPTFTLERRHVHCRAAGVDSRINLVIDGYTLNRDPIYGGLKRVLSGEKPHWVTIDAGMWKGRRAYLELVDLAPADLADESRKSGYGPNGFVAVERVVFSDEATPPELPSAQATLPVSVPADERLSRLLADYRQVESSIPEPTSVPAMADGSGDDERVFLRGNPRNLGELAPRRFLAAIAGPEQPPVERGSGRRELARRIADPSNPFLARVMVNRVWHHLLGRGLVPTVDDFGALGQPPSHPELLDWLAAWYRSEGWSTKKLIRLLVTSSAYGMSSAPADAAAEERDPENVLLHRMRLRRMEGEAVRDKILSVSGRLDVLPFGPPVPVHLTPFQDGRGRPAQSGPLDGAGRRSIYAEVRRNFLSPLMLAFDTPLPAATVGRRSLSNVPAQALILMNDPFIAGQAAAWASRVLEGKAPAPEDRIRAMYQAAFSRPPSGQELEDALVFLREQSILYRDATGEAAGGEKVWADLCHVLFNVKEFIYIN